MRQREAWERSWESCSTQPRRQQHPLFVFSQFLASYSPNCLSCLLCPLPSFGFSCQETKTDRTHSLYIFSFPFISFLLLNKTEPDIINECHENLGNRPSSPLLFAWQWKSEGEEKNHEQRMQMTGPLFHSDVDSHSCFPFSHDCIFRLLWKEHRLLVFPWI